MTIHYPFPSIGQIKDVEKEVAHQYRDEELPILQFRGTVKLHGSNGAVIAKFSKEKILQEIYCQSRNRVLSLANDNCGFAKFIHDIPKDILVKNLFEPILEFLDCTTDFIIIVFGEFCGGSIQKGVALNQLPKMFVSFAVSLYMEEKQRRLDPELLQANNKEYNLYNINMFPVHDIDIDFKNPSKSYDTLIKSTELVEQECPVGKYFGVSGTGEGIVYQCENFTSSKFWFKVKGEKHAVVKSKGIITVDTEKVENVQQFCEKTVTENRLNQGLDYLQEMGFSRFEKQNVGQFIRWVVNDILKEHQDIMQESGLTKGDVSKLIGIKARAHFFDTLNQ